MHTYPTRPGLDPVEALESIVRPQSVVVIGANEVEGKLTSGSVRNLLRHKYSGRLYVVNPNRSSVYGVKTLPSVADLPEVPDTAVIVLSAARAVQALAECAQLGIRTATLVAAGFGEAGGAAGGAATRQALVELLEQTGMRILGPNTAGLFNVVDGYVPRAAHNHPADLLAGRIGVVAQSGGLCNTLVNRSISSGVGIAMAVSTGNQLDLDLWDVGDYLLSQPSVDVVTTIIEGFSAPAKFVEFAQRAQAVNKPIVALKLGRSEAGRLAVATHSGSVAGAAEVQSAVLRDLNVIQVDELDELWEVASLITRWGVPRRRAHRLGVVTPSGGDGAIVADEVSRVGLSMAELSPGTCEKFGQIAPEVTPANPFDTQAALAVSAPDSLSGQIAAVAGDGGTDAVLLALPVLATEGAVASLGPHIEGLRASGQRNIAVSAWMAGDATSGAVGVIRETGWPLFDGSVRAVRAIAHYDGYARRCDQLPSISADSVRAAAGDDAPAELLTYWAARQLLADLGVPFNRAVLAGDAETVVRRAHEIEFPVTLKFSSNAFTHKADAGALLQAVSDDVTIRDFADSALGRWPVHAADEGVTVEEHVYSNLPVFIGGHRDAEFGPVILVGLGGGFAEPYSDIARIPAPADAGQVRRALDTTTLAILLRKRRGAFDAIVETVAGLSQALHSDPAIRSFDINPVLVRDDGSIVAVDARVERRSVGG
ncbi:acetate--CoA ligase family protein [Streptomyces sp. NPDC002619]|uniref:acetate--CoA ligase family protein n=1 Tax=Streptomyces sp. NPDC002619 TaxID=3364655 RepID=UPI00369B3862